MLGSGTVFHNIYTRIQNCIGQFTKPTTSLTILSLKHTSVQVIIKYKKFLVVHYPCWSECTLCFLEFRIYVVGEGHRCDILCDPGSIIGCKAGINSNGCLSGLPTDMAGNLFACRWVGCCRTSKTHNTCRSNARMQLPSLPSHICIQRPMLDFPRDRNLYEIN